jgi:hypothetical protein
MQSSGQSAAAMTHRDTPASLLPSPVPAGWMGRKPCDRRTPRGHDGRQGRGGLCLGRSALADREGDPVAVTLPESRAVQTSGIASRSADGYSK